MLPGSPAVFSPHPETERGCGPGGGTGATWEAAEGWGCPWLSRGALAPSRAQPALLVLGLGSSSPLLRSRVHWRTEWGNEWDICRMSVYRLPISLSLFLLFLRQDFAM